MRLHAEGRWAVTATDTHVGKTCVAAALLENLVSVGHRPFAYKPYESGVAVSSPQSDSRRLQRAGGGWQPLHTVTLHRFRAPLAPAVAARLEGRTASWVHTLRGFRRLGPGPGVVEGAGGLYVPLDPRHDVIDLLAALKLPVVLVARAGLGTINHTSLSVKALHDAGVPVDAVVLVKSTPGKDASEPHNPGELQRRFPSLQVLGPVPFVRDEARRAAAFRRVVAPLTARVPTLR